MGNANDSSRKAIVQETVFNTPVNTQVQFDGQQFTDFIGAHGAPCEIERAIKCPCFVNVTQNPLTTCMNCGGTGWVFVDKQQSIVALTSISNKTKLQTWSEQNAGTVNITALAKDRMAFMDKITAVDEEDIYSQVKDIRYSNSNIPFIFLTYNPILIFDIYIFVGDKLPFIFVDPVNYSVAVNKIIFDATFITNLKSQYSIQTVTASIRYSYHPCYHILDIPRSIRRYQDTGSGRIYYPIQAIGRKAQYVLDAPNFSGDKLFDNTNYTRTPIDYARTFAVKFVEGSESNQAEINESGQLEQPENPPYQ